MKLSDLFVVDIRLSPLARLQLRQLLKAGLADMPADALGPALRERFCGLLAEALVDELPEQPLGDALPGLAELAPEHLGDWGLSPRLGHALARAGIGGCAGVSRLTLDLSTLRPYVGGDKQRELAARAAELLLVGALAAGEDTAVEAVRRDLVRQAGREPPRVAVAAQGDRHG